MKKTIAISLLIVTLFSYSQTAINSWNISLTKDVQIFPIKNQKSDEISLCFYGKKQLTIAEVDELMNIKDSVTFDKPSSEYSSLRGYALAENNTTHLFWMKNNSKEMMVVEYNFNTRKNKTLSIFSLPKDELYWDSFTNKNNYFLISYSKEKNGIKFYSFDNQGKEKSTEIDFSNYKIVDAKYKPTTIPSLIRNNSYSSIETESMVSVLKASKNIKTYQNENIYTITFDHNRNYTQVITINLSDYSHSNKYINKPSIPEIDNEFIKANSFILDGKIFQYKLGSQNLAFQIDVLENSNPKIYSIENDQPITWKNSDIVQQFGDGIRILEKPNQLINKMNNMNNDGLSVYKLGENYLVTLGVVSEAQQSGGAAIAGGFGMIGAVVYVSLSSNASYNNFMDYANRKFVYFYALFDVNGNHVNTTLKPLAFEQIQNYFKDIEKHHSITLFKTKNTYIVGSYDRKAKIFFWKKFVD